jgi:hypothetical protein
VFWRKMFHRKLITKDRIDSSKGYVVGNIQWVHKHINKMKNKYPQDHFIEMCRLVAENNKDG